MNKMITSVTKPMLTGFTLVELVIAIAVAGIVISGVVVTSAELVKRSADPLLAIQRVHIAQAYLDEIRAQRFATVDSSCPTAADGRSSFTHVCQYDSLTNAAIEDQFGNSQPQLNHYTVSVDVSNTAVGASRLGTPSALIPNADTAVVTVTVKSPDAAITVLSGYIINGA